MTKYQQLKKKFPHVLFHADRVKREKKSIVESYRLYNHVRDMVLRSMFGGRPLWKNVRNSKLNDNGD